MNLGNCHTLFLMLYMFYFILLLLLLLLLRLFGGVVRPHRQQPIRLPRPWDSPGKNSKWVAIAFSNA